jgi:N-acylglucosamine 2-epimerase
LLAHSITGDPKYEEWFEKVQDYAFSHFEDKEYGEWFGYLHRDGSVSNTLKGSMWKGMFHVPRALLLNYLLLTKMKKD